MFNSKQVAAHLPLLRRYARALTGSQSLGDAYVRSAIEVLVGTEVTLDSDLSSRVALYRLFHKVLGSLAGLDRGEGFAAATTPEDRLQGMTPANRQALLLSAVEGFSFLEIGQILDIDAEAAEQLALAAQVEIERELATEVLVIEDEVIIAMDISSLLQELGHRVQGVARTRTEALSEATKRRPGLILADIHLADGSSGADAVADILKLFDVPVVFVTSHPELMLTGAGSEPTYLVTKPFDRNALKATIDQALFFHRSATDQNLIATG